MLARLQMRQARRRLWRNTLNRCDCSGYWFPHRKTGGACLAGPRCELYLALRQGVDKGEAEALLWAHQLERLPP
jgi:hypothetical protein